MLMWICVGTASTPKADGTSIFDAGLKGDDKKEILFSAPRAVADFDVQDVLKGPLPARHIQVTFPDLPPPTGADIQEYARLTPGERVLVFLKRDAKTGELTLLFPSSMPGPKIIVGAAKPAHTDAATTPLRRVLLYLTPGLSDKEPRIRRDRLFQISQINYLLDLPPTDPPTAFFSNWEVWHSILIGVGEPSSPPLEQFVTEYVLPAVVTATKDADPAVRITSIATATELQDISFIPQLVDMMTHGSPEARAEAAGGLRGIHTLRAEKAMVALLDNPNAEVRQRAAYYLREKGDLRTLPFLMDHLEDADLTVRQMVISALFVMTGVSGPPRPASGDVSEATYIAFGRQWAVENKEKLADWRAQFAKIP